MNLRIHLDKKDHEATFFTKVKFSISICNLRHLFEHFRWMKMASQILSDDPFGMSVSSLLISLKLSKIVMQTVIYLNHNKTCELT